MSRWNLPVWDRRLWPCRSSSTRTEVSTALLRIKTDALGAPEALNQPELARTCPAALWDWLRPAGRRILAFRRVQGAAGHRCAPGARSSSCKGSSRQNASPISATRRPTSLVSCSRPRSRLVPATSVAADLITRCGRCIRRGLPAAIFCSHKDPLHKDWPRSSPQTRQRPQDPSPSP